MVTWPRSLTAIQMLTFMVQVEYLSRHRYSLVVLSLNLFQTIEFQGNKLDKIGVYSDMHKHMEEVVDDSRTM